MCVFIHQVMSNSLRPHGLQYARPPCPSPSLRVCPSSCPLNWWCHPTISSSVTPFSFCLQSFPTSGSFPLSPLFASGGQSIGASASASVLAVNIQGWLPLKVKVKVALRIDHFALCYPRDSSRVFSRAAVQKHQFFGTLASLWSYCHIRTWPVERP